MAGPVITSGMIASVAWDALYLGQQIMLTTHWRITMSAGSPPDLTQFYEAVRQKNDALAGLGDFVSACYTEDVTQIKLRVQIIHPLRYSAQVFFSNPVMGQRTPPAVKLPPGNAGALTLRSFNAGDHTHGTKHILATKPEDIADGEIGTDFADALNDLGDQLATSITLDAPFNMCRLDPCVYNRAAPGTSVLIDQHQLQPHARIMRRRTVGLGS